MSSKPGKTAPKLLQDLLTYDPRYEDRAGRNLLTTSPPHYDPNTERTPAVPRRNCRHSFLTKPEQSELPIAGRDPDASTKYKIACFCQKCRLHLDLIVDFRDDGSKNQPCQILSGDYSIHHFIFQEEEDGSNQMDAFGWTTPRNYRFCCSAPKCPVELQIRLHPPRLSDQDILLMTDRSQLRRRLDAAKRLAGDRADTTMARPVDALDFLSTYLGDSLSPKQGKSRIPLLNRRFVKTFGQDCDNILKKLGFTTAIEIEESGDSAVVWYLPKPPAAPHALAEDEPERTIVIDARYELHALILAFPEHERIGARHPPVPAQPSITDIQRALGCLDYSKRPVRETRSANQEEDHPYYAGLGAVGDFADELLLFAYTRQSAVDPYNAAYYFECLQAIAIGRNSEELSTTVMTLASQGVSNRQEVAAAYKYFGIEPAHAPVLQDDHIIGLFKSRLQDIGPAAVEESRKQLRVIGGARNSERIMQVSNDALENYEQALEWLGLDENQADEFVITMYGIKISDNASDTETARKAVRLIATKRRSKRLHDFLDHGDLGEPTSLDIGEAYAILQVKDRAAPLSLDVLQATMAVMIADQPSSEARYQQAYDLICEDQKNFYNNSQVQIDGPPRSTYQMDAWPVGLRNIGNTCYLNSVLQFLFTIKPLRNAVLDATKFVEDLPPEELEKKIVGRSAVRLEKLEKARIFVRELRSLLQHMIAQPDYIVRPEEKLAALALVEKAEPVNINAIDSRGLGDIGGVPIAGPMLPPEAGLDTTVKPPTASLADSVMGSDDAKSNTSTTAIADDDDPPPLVPVSKPDPPSRPPPVPPRPQVPARTDANTMSKIELNATQQDAAEILNNIFDLLSCALIGTGTMPDGEQIDLIKSLFFTEVTTVYSGGLEARKSAIQDAHHISPGWRNRPLYAALDDEFTKTEVEKDPKKDTVTSKYAYIERPSPIQIINVRRNLWEDNREKKDYSQVILPEELFLDRYLQKTKSRSEDDMLKLREEQWGLQEQLREKDGRKKLLTETEHKIGLPDAVDEAAASIDNFSKSSEDQLIDVDADPIPRFPGLSDTLRERARNLREELETLDQDMKELDKKINSLFDNCKDHPYRLHAVLMHRGSATGGHYFIYIYDAQVKRWRKYNDDRVDWVTVDEVFEHTATYPQTSTTIVYVREDQICELTEAVHRQIPTPPTLPTPPLENEIEMKDVDNHVIGGMQVIEGIEMKE